MPGIESTAAVILGPQQRAERVSQAGPVARRLTAAGVTMVALCWVDNTVSPGPRPSRWGAWSAAAGGASGCRRCSTCS